MEATTYHLDCKAGDILGFSAWSHWGVLINLATWGVPFWSLSHVALIAMSPEDSIWPLCFESTSLYKQRCFIQGRTLNGVQAHATGLRVASYRGRVWLYRRAKPLTQDQSDRLTKFCLNHLGYEYDRIGAFRARGVGFGWLERLLRHEDLTSIFCSEFCPAALRAADGFATGNVSKWSPNSFAREYVRRGLVNEVVRV